MLGFIPPRPADCERERERVIDQDKSFHTVRRLLVPERMESDTLSSTNALNFDICTKSSHVLSCRS